MNHSKIYKCTIVGSGFSGICLAIKLKRHGIDDFIILEKADEVGGTWRDNHYPGAECDVPSALYSFSFETKTDWDYQWSEQPQILEYIKNTARKNGVMDHIRFGSALLSADYDSGKDTGSCSLPMARPCTHISWSAPSASYINPMFRNTRASKPLQAHAFIQPTGITLSSSAASR